MKYVCCVDRQKQIQESRNIVLQGVFKKLKALWGRCRNNGILWSLQGEE